MAKAKQVPDAATRADLSEWASEVLHLRLDEVISFGGAALVPGNVNGVHDLRVALRRLRSVLRDFDAVLDEKKAARVKKDLKLIAGALGPVRDQDVANILLKDFAGETGKETIGAGIAALVDELAAERQRSHKKYCRVAARISFDDIGDGIDNAMRQSKLFRPPTIKAAGSDVVTARVSDLVDTAGAIYEPLNTVGLHDIRIAVKRLRYAIELFASLWGDEAAGIAGDLSKMQKHLGDLHDCDIWIEKLGERIRRKSKPDDQMALPAAAWLISKFGADRSEAYLAAFELWDKWQADGFTDRVHSLISPGN